ncbi:MAG: CrcB family protein [Balneolaceae bacterium]|nr:CrcB family protein [Balneolaceae bacterium]MCH8549442.1 CrcB family protein [Balneolaceae bacterium]
MTNLLLVAAGGAIGAVLRFLVALWVGSFSGRPESLTGTVIANVTGCFLAGLLLGWVSVAGTPGESAMLFLTIGILGSYTTFSTFVLELSGMIESEKKQLILYIFWQLVVALFAAAGGVILGAAAAGGTFG